MFTILFTSSVAESAASSQTTYPNTAKRKGMILPFQPLTMTFHDVNYFVDMPKVRILDFILHFTTGLAAH